MGNDVWPLVHAERAALIDDLAGVAAQRWAESTPCAGWTVHDVVAHLVNTAKTTRVGFVAAMVRSRFDFDRLNAAGVARERGATPRETLDRLRAVATRTSTPPAPLGTRLVEEIVHGEDIRRPLGITRDYPLPALVRALRVQTTMKESFGGARDLVTRIRLVATDTDLSIGTGPEVRGTALQLLLAVTGRPVAELTGPGAVELAGQR